MVNTKAWLERPKIIIFIGFLIFIIGFGWEVFYLGFNIFWGLIFTSYFPYIPLCIALMMFGVTVAALGSRVSTKRWKKTGIFLFSGYLFVAMVFIVPSYAYESMPLNTVHKVVWVSDVTLVNSHTGNPLGVLKFQMAIDNSTDGSDWNYNLSFDSNQPISNVSGTGIFEIIPFDYGKTYAGFNIPWIDFSVPNHGDLVYSLGSNPLTLPYFPPQKGISVLCEIARLNVTFENGTSLTHFEIGSDFSPFQPWLGTSPQLFYLEDMTNSMSIDVS